MPELVHHWIAAHGHLIALLAGLSLLMFIASLFALPFLVARLPEDYFLDPQRHASRLRRLHPLVYLTILVVKNLLGWILVLAGIAMLVLPGQGLLTLFMGLVLCDFPGKFALERRLACQPALLGAINWLRGRAHQGPLLPPRHPDGRPCVELRAKGSGPLPPDPENR